MKVKKIEDHYEINPERFSGSFEELILEAEKQTGEHFSVLHIRNAESGNITHFSIASDGKGGLKSRREDYSDYEIMSQSVAIASGDSIWVEA